MRVYRAIQAFYFGEIDEYSPEDDFQAISCGEEIGELDGCIGLIVKGTMVPISLPTTVLSFLLLIGMVPDPAGACDTGTQGPQGPQGPGGSGVGGDSITVTASRDVATVTNTYLHSDDGTPMSTVPRELPFNCTLIAMSATCRTASVFTAEVHVGLALIAGATLVVNGLGNNGSYSINLNKGDRVQLFCNGANVDRPSIAAVFRRR